jgi:hypothetical protein
MTARFITEDAETHRTQLRGVPFAGPALIAVLVRFDDWMRSFHSRPEKSFDQALESGELDQMLDGIERISDSLIRAAEGVDRALLSKSLQETLIYSAGFDERRTPLKIRSRLMQATSPHDRRQTLQQFLCLYFFNSVWFRTREEIRSVAASAAAFEKEMESVEAVCRQIVASNWKSVPAEPPLDFATARDLVEAIDGQLSTFWVAVCP